MNPNSEKTARELIAELCDGVIQPNDFSRIEQLMRDDPILQHEYLDQAMVDGMLRYEFGADRPSSPLHLEPAKRKKRRVGSVARSFIFVVFTAICTAGYWWLQLNRDVEFVIPLSNVSFENDQPISNELILNGWYGDVARIVPSSDDNIAPDGKRMLQLIRSVHQPATECEIYQVLDLRRAASQTEFPSGFIEATAMVNSRSTAIDQPYTLSLEFYTCAEQPEIQNTLAPESWSSDMMTAGKKVIADSDKQSWQQLRLVMPLSRDAKFGIVKISVRDVSNAGDGEFLGVFVDNVQVRLTSKGLL